MFASEATTIGAGIALGDSGAMTSGEAGFLMEAGLDLPLLTNPPEEMRAAAATTDDGMFDVIGAMTSGDGTADEFATTVGIVSGDVASDAVVSDRR